MKEQIADRWVEELRSGKYKQGKGKLRTSHNYYCCLGVLCELSPIEAKLYPNHDTYIYDNQCAGLPRSVSEWSGVKDSLGHIDGYRHTLSVLNDAGGDGLDPLSFDEIADVIQMTYEDL